MPRQAGESAVTLSVFDRLIDEDPKTRVEAPLSRAQSVRILRSAVRRDLEWLLNTRRTPLESTELLAELAHSAYSFGLPDFSAYSMGNQRDQARLLSALQTAVKTFEPRLVNAKIIPLESTEVGSRILRFRIEGQLDMDPAPELISFDTVLKLTSGVYEVKGGGDER
jgi:type VI secretion system protein ImpF